VAAADAGVVGWPVSPDMWPGAAILDGDYKVPPVVEVK